MPHGTRWSILFMLAGLLACAPAPRTPSQLVAALESTDDSVRKQAAYELRLRRVPVEAVSPLLAVEERTEDPDARGEVLLTLGASGADEAWPVIVRASQDPHEDIRRYAATARRYWLVATGRLMPSPDPYRAPARRRSWGYTPTPQPVTPSAHDIIHPGSYNPRTGTIQQSYSHQYTSPPSPPPPPLPPPPPPYYPR